MTEFTVPDGAGWFEKHVVESLGRMERNLETLASRVQANEVEVEGRLSRLETRVLLWGGLAVFVVTPIVATLITKVLK